MKLDCGNGEVIGICYCEFCKASGGKIQFRDDLTGEIIIRSGIWLRDKLREEGGLEE